jgi:hypothetical protein
MAGTSTGDGAGRDDETRDDDVREPPHDVPRGDGDLGDDEVEARWADIVAQLGDVDIDDDAGGAGPDGPAAAAPAPGQTAGHVVARAAGPRDWPATPDVEAAAEAESHFTPPDPGPVLTSRDPLVTLAWCGVAGVPLLAVVALIVRAFVPSMYVPSWVGPAAVLVFLACVAVLIWRMPTGRDPDDRGNGAVV